MDGKMKYYSSTEERVFDVVVEGDQASLVGQNRVKASVWGGGVTANASQLETSGWALADCQPGGQYLLI
ncbi:hypothetical protein PS385_01825 [Limosilactobacillus fermentum]|nr:hypothetical protein [Limosilactobacillus fermentum]